MNSVKLVVFLFSITHLIWYFSIKKIYVGSKIPPAASQLILTSLVLFSLLNKPICRDLEAICRLGEAPFICRKKSQTFQ